MRGGLQGLEIVSTVEGELRAVLDESLEGLVPGDEVGFRVDLDDGAAATIERDYRFSE